MDFDGSPIESVEAKLPSFIVELPEGYRRGTHLKMEIEFRVRSVRYEENRKGELIQQLILAVEEIELKKVITLEEEVVSLGEAVQEEDPESEQVSEIDGQLAIEEIREEIGEPGTDLATRELERAIADSAPEVEFMDGDLRVDAPYDATVGF